MHNSGERASKVGVLTAAKFKGEGSRKRRADQPDIQRRALEYRKNEM